MYSRVLKQEQGQDGVRVVALAPGIVDTDMQGAIRASDPADFPPWNASGNSTPPASCPRPPTWLPAFSPTWIATISEPPKSTTSATTSNPP